MNNNHEFNIIKSNKIKPIQFQQRFNILNVATRVSYFLIVRQCRIRELYQICVFALLRQFYQCCAGLYSLYLFQTSFQLPLETIKSKENACKIFAKRIVCHSFPCGAILCSLLTLIGSLKQSKMKAYDIAINTSSVLASLVSKNDFFLLLSQILFRQFYVYLFFRDCSVIIMSDYNERVNLKNKINLYYMRLFFLLLDPYQKRNKII